MKALIVRTPFADYAKGERITDAKTLEDILAGHNVHHVIQIEHNEPEHKPDDETEADGVDHESSNAGDAA